MEPIFSNNSKFWILIPSIFRFNGPVSWASLPQLWKRPNLICSGNMASRVKNSSRNQEAIWSKSCWSPKSRDTMAMVTQHVSARVVATQTNLCWRHMHPASPSKSWVNADAFDVPPFLWGMIQNCHWCLFCGASSNPVLLTLKRHFCWWSTQEQTGIRNPHCMFFKLAVVRGPSVNYCSNPRLWIWIAACCVWLCTCAQHFWVASHPNTMNDQTRNPKFFVWSLKTLFSQQGAPGPSAVGAILWPWAMSGLQTG